MTYRIEKSENRGHSKLDWLDSRFSYSFANYLNPERMGFGKLLVLNDDIVDGNSGFGTHPHNNMEIISIPIYGEITHKDTAGFQDVVKPGMVQVMSAGSGIAHSEMNKTNSPANFLQIWIEPNELNVKPHYESRNFDYKKNELNQIVNGSGIKIHQDAKVFYSDFQEYKTNYELSKDYGIFIFVIEGSLKVNNLKLEKRDSIEIWEENNVEISGSAKFIIIETIL